MSGESKLLLIFSSMFKQLKHLGTLLIDIPLAIMLTLMEYLEIITWSRDKKIKKDFNNYDKEKTFSENVDDVLNCLRLIRNEQYLEAQRKIQDKINNDQS